MNEIIHTHLRFEGGYKFNVTFDEIGGTLHTDEPKPVGRDEGPTASMMLSAAVGHCLASSLLFCLEKSRVKAKDIEADVITSTRRAEGGRWRIGDIKVNLKMDIAEGDKEKFERCKGMFQDFCVVSSSIRNGIPIDVNVERM